MQRQKENPSQMKTIGNNNSVRQSNIELLRMLAMFMVLLVHADFFSLGSPSSDEILHKPYDAFLRIFFESVSIVCVNVFVLISGWFGIKPSFKGFCNFLYQCLFFLVGLYVTTILIGVNKISIEGLAGCIFATRLNWFIKAYLLLYFLCPVLNAFVKTASQKTFKLVLISFFTFTCTYGWLGAATFMADGYTTLFFIGLYLLARYTRIYEPKWAQHEPSIYLYAYFTSVMFVTFIVFICPYLFNRDVPVKFYSYICPTTIIGAISLLMCFTKIKIQNRFINKCGISCFAVFLIHVSPSTLWHFTRLFKYLHNHYSIASFWLITFVLLSIIFIIAILIDKIRIKTFNSLYAKVFIKWEALFNKYK